MRRTIFYSWQTDLSARCNRNFIEDGLRRALRAIQRDEAEEIEPVLDRDTAGIAGSPDIANSIFAKISLADVFVADVSIINPEGPGRLTPNPNVIVELGYAISELGWDRILLVMNTAFGQPEVLPFDLRGRRVISYQFADHDGEDRAEARGLLQGRFEGALRTAIGKAAGEYLPTGPEASLWWGKWSIPSDGRGHGGEVFVREVGPAGFLFDISVFNGAHTGQLTCYARIVSSDLAYARVKNLQDQPDGELVFRRKLRDGRRWMSVEETVGCFAWHGMGASFNGDFVYRFNGLFELGCVHELDLIRAYSVLGQFYDAFMERTQLIGEAEDLDNEGARVLTGGVRGLFTTMESILMLASNGGIWAAFIDDDVVRYVTNRPDWKDRLPRTIEHWRGRFAQIPVSYHPVVETVPQRFV